jgi:hypothetical protein
LEAERPYDSKHVSFREFYDFLEVAQPDKSFRLREGSNIADGADKI